MPREDHVEILLATYQGARFLEEQLESILSQTHRSWTLIARDDGSSDDTPAILERYAKRHLGRIRLLPRDGRRLGALGSFDVLIEASRAGHVMFCDQDDVWLPDKIEVTLSAMREREARTGSSVPLLVHTDLRVVDEELRAIAPSFWAFQQLSPRLAALPRVLLQNFVTGCTAMMNRALCTLAAPVPREARMHDWWLALVALQFGAIVSVPQATVLYRQHGRNERGAEHFSVFRAALQAFDRERWRRSSQTRSVELRGAETQASAFLARFRDRLSTEARETLEAFSALGRQGPLARRASIIRHGFFYANPLTTAAMLLFR